MKALVFLALIGFWASSALAQVQVMPRYIYVLHGGVDAVWGQYMFMVQNTDAEAKTETFKVVLPKETVDWQAQDGFQGKDFKLGSDGGLEFTKAFNPGDNVHTVGFKVSAIGGEAEMTMTLPIDLNEFSIMTQNNLVIEGEGVEVNKKTGNQKYDKYNFYNLSAGDTIKVKVLGVSKGRAEYWRYGFIAGAIIIISCLSLAYWTRPKEASGS